MHDSFRSFILFTWSNWYAYLNGQIWLGASGEQGKYLRLQQYNVRGPSWYLAPSPHNSNIKHKYKKIVVHTHHIIKSKERYSNSHNQAIGNTFIFSNCSSKKIYSYGVFYQDSSNGRGNFLFKHKRNKIHP